MPLYTNPLDPSAKSGGFVYSGMLQNAEEYGSNLAGHLIWRKLRNTSSL